MLAAGAITLGVGFPVGGASALGGKVYGVKNCSQPEVRPVRIVLACGDGGLWVNGIHYQSWGGTSVHGRGVLHAKTCNPICEGSRVKDYPVTFRLYRVRRITCAGRSVRTYRRIHVHPTNGNPPRFRAFRDTSLFCA